MALISFVSDTNRWNNQLSSTFLKDKLAGLKRLHAQRMGISATNSFKIRTVKKPMQL